MRGSGDRQAVRDLFTVRGCTAHIRLYLAPYLGQVLLAELSAGQVQAMFTAIFRQHYALGTPGIGGDADPDRRHPARR